MMSLSPNYYLWVFGTESRHVVINQVEDKTSVHECQAPLQKAQMGKGGINYYKMNTPPQPPPTLLHRRTVPSLMVALWSKSQVSGDICFLKQRHWSLPDETSSRTEWSPLPNSQCEGTGCNFWTVKQKHLSHAQKLSVASLHYFCKKLECSCNGWIVATMDQVLDSTPFSWRMYLMANWIVSWLWMELFTGTLAAMLASYLEPAQSIEGNSGTII